MDTKKEIKVRDRVQTLAGDIRGEVTSIFQDRYRKTWYRVRVDNGARAIIHENQIIHERTNGGKSKTK